MSEVVKTKMECIFNGYSTKKNGDIDLKFKAPYSELVNTMSLLRMINCNIGVEAKVNADKPCSLGTFYLQKVSIDHDGESSFTFNTELSSSEIDNFKFLLEPESIIKLLCKAVIEDE